MSPNPPSRNDGNFGASIGALALIAVGVIFFLDNLGFIPNIRPYWPLVVSAWGLVTLFSMRNVCGAIWALALIAAGLLVTAGNLGVIHANFGNIWPIWLIAAGASMLVKRSGWGQGALWGPQSLWTWPESHSSQHFFGPGFGPAERFRRKFFGNILHVNAVFGSVNRRIDSLNFEGADLNSSFGELKIDLRGATISTPNREATIRTNAAFGAIKLRVPETWRVVVHGSAVFGSYEDKTVPPRPVPGVDPPTLIIYGSAAFGAVEIEN